MFFNKKRNIVCILILSIILLCLLITSIIFYRSQKGSLPLTIKITSNDVTETIVPWCDENGKWYFFMPSYSNESNTVLIANGNGCCLQGTLLPHQQTIGTIKTDTEYHFEQHTLFADWDTTVVFLKSANVSSLYIDTRSGNMDKVNSDKENKELVNVTLYNESGNQIYHSNDFSDKINGHGNSTWFYEKKPYNLSLDSPAKLIDNNENTNYVLIANAIDKTSMRNRTIYDMAKITFPEWNVSTKYIDLYTNGDYRGLYLLTDKVEVSENKLNLPDDCFLYNLELNDRAQTESVKDIIPGISAELKNGKAYTDFEKDTAKNTICEIFNGITEKAFNEEELGSYIDIDSWASLYICQEFSSNYDSGKCSLYFYLKNGKLYAGPLWDYDNTFGLRKDFQADGFCACVKKSAIWSSLTKYESFNCRVSELYKEIFLPVINEILEVKYNELSEQIQKAVETDNIRWHNFSISFFADDYIYDFSEFIKVKRDFLNSIWIQKESYNNVFVETSSGTIYFTIKNSESGEKIYRFLSKNIDEGNAVRYIDGKTENEYDFTAPITEDKILYALTDTEELNWKGRLVEWMLLHESLVILSMLCCALAFIGIILIYFDIKRNRKGGNG